MTRVYYIAAEFDLVEKPEWLDGFRAKYDEPFKYHVTLKAPTLIDESQLASIRKKLVVITERFERFEVVFDRYDFGKTDSGHVVMIFAGPNPTLAELQRAVQQELAGVGQFAKPQYAKFDSDFRPHITIARHLDDARFTEAKTELKEPVLCKASVTGITLAVSDPSVPVDPTRAQTTTYAFKI